MSKDKESIFEITPELYESCKVKPELGEACKIPGQPITGAADPMSEQDITRTAEI